ncbi:MAG TPA: rhamnulokinase family protein [Gemmataceae bacterium]|jgi:rhamnulokinase|nr:rhamnulokinase family protein [Gemmataceae bacterium]
MDKKILAFDLGAESGRGVLGLFDGRKLRLEVIHRFPNGPVRTLDTMHWDVLRLYSEMLVTLRRCAGEHGEIASLGVDTWGVDFGLLGRGGALLGNPRHYRDPHTEWIMEAAFAKVSREEIFRQTGLQFMRFNSLFQLLALQRDRSPLLDMAENLLFIPDLFHYFFTGIKVNEFTDTTTSQLYDPTHKRWAYGLVKAFDLPGKILGTIVNPGTVLGPLRTSVASETGVKPIQVIVPSTHDTGSAIAAVPAKGGFDFAPDASHESKHATSAKRQATVGSPNWVYISSGTWSLMGAELSAPLINDKAREYNFTNEGGVGGTIRFLKNIMGLWLVQECRRSWEREAKTYSYDDLTRLAENAPPLVSLVNPDDAGFILPEHMPRALADFCRKTSQPAPVEPGSVIRCALESLALRYRWVLERLEELLDRRFETLHVVGGGCQNALLCQFTADACNRPVLAGPVEATAIGNILVQAVGLGILSSLSEAREVVRNSFEVKTYTPQQSDRWEAPYQRFLKFL